MRVIYPIIYPTPPSSLGQNIIIVDDFWYDIK